MFSIQDILMYIQAGKYRLSEHVKDRMDSRDVTIDEIIEAIKMGRIISEHPDAEPNPSCLINGTTFSGRVLQIAIGLEIDGVILITVYDHDRDHMVMLGQKSKGRRNRNGRKR